MCSSIDLGIITISGYGLMIAIGVLCLATFITYQFRKTKISEKDIDKLILLTAFCGLALYLSASFFDNLWHSIAYYQEYGKWKWVEYGVTFSGGLFGGLVAYFAVYFFIFKKQKYNFNYYINIIIQGVIITHAFGRIGCFCGGCCYGQPTDSWLGVEFDPIHNPGVMYMPVMLFEAAFLFILFIVMVLFVRRHQFRYYLLSYGVWRFIIEFFRGDDRGGVILGMSPSQFLSVIMIIGGIVLWIFEDKWAKNAYQKAKIKYGDEIVPLYHDKLESDFSKPDFTYFKEYIDNIFNKKEKEKQNKNLEILEKDTISDDNKTQEEKN